jgi:hydroxymethylpyrimidine/phosphomethylpyrimidine kinase
MEAERPYLLTIAGFDPSGGAGILADIKTFEMNKVYGQAVCTAVTYQNEKEFDDVKWLTSAEILRQLRVLLRIRSFSLVKIGLIENLDTVEQVVTELHLHNPDVKIIWDPVFKASAGFRFHEDLQTEKLEKICKKLFLITPNLYEIGKIYPEETPVAGAERLSRFVNVLLKGGHADAATSVDVLYEGINRFSYEAMRSEYDKHGTGCVLSSAILTNLSRGYDLADACREAKDYVTDFINSHVSLLGFHYV